MSTFAGSMVLTESFWETIFGLVAAAAAASLVVAAIREAPPARRATVANVALACIWVAVFVVGAALVWMDTASAGAAALLIAASELALAAAVWLGRSRRRVDQTLPGSWWDRWEAQLEGHSWLEQTRKPRKH